MQLATATALRALFGPHSFFLSLLWLGSLGYPRIWSSRLSRTRAVVHSFRDTSIALDSAAALGFPLNNTNAPTVIKIAPTSRPLGQDGYQVLVETDAEVSRALIFFFLG